MTEFEKVLEECLLDLERGASSVDGCLRRHPNYALPLKPVLLTATQLEYGREARPSAAFKARVRAKVIQGMQAHPRRRMNFNFMFTRLKASLAAIVLALLVAGTAYAQSVLPGDVFYPWKLASENAWRVVSPDPVGTDLAIADRRVNELIAVGNDPLMYSQAMKAYLEVLARLKSEMDAENEARILQRLDSQIEELNSSGILPTQIDPDPIPQLQDVLPQLDEPTPTLPAIPTLVPQIPQTNPTDLPNVVPTIKTKIPPVNPTHLPEIVPTIQDAPEIIPTIQITSPIP